MKNVILSLLFVAIATVGVKAQTATTSTTVQLNVVLKSLIGIEIGNESGDTEYKGGGSAADYGDVVNLEYKTAEDYQNGVSKTVEGQLKVTSIGSQFKLYVQTFESRTNTASGVLKRVSGGHNTMDGNLVTVSVSGVQSGQARSVHQLQGQQDYGNMTGGATAGTDLDVTYTAAALTDAQVAALLQNHHGNEVVYTTDVVYTVMAQ